MVAGLKSGQSVNAPLRATLNHAASDAQHFAAGRVNNSQYELGSLEITTHGEEHRILGYRYR